MKRTSRLSTRPAIALAVLFWVGAGTLAARADGPGFPEAFSVSHCETFPESRAEVVRGPRLGLDAATGKVVRRNSTFPRYPCADAPRTSGRGVDAIGVYIDAGPVQADPEDAAPWRRRGGAPR